MIALVGVGGTLAGALLSYFGQAVMEGKRTEREEAARFHDEKRAVYGAFIAHLNVRRKYSDDLTIYWDTPHLEHVMAQAPDEGEWLREAQELMASIHLLADEEVISRATSLLMTTLAQPLILAAPFGTPATREQVRERHDNGVKLYRDAYAECLAAMRTSLNVPKAARFHVI